MKAIPFKGKMMTPRDLTKYLEKYRIELEKKDAGEESLLITKIDSARKAGLDISACMYTYTAGATGFDASMPTYVQEGGLDKWVERLKDPEIRKKILCAASGLVRVDSSSLTIRAHSSRKVVGWPLTARLA